MTEELEVCGKCGKTITASEFDVNWGWCKDCLTKDYEEYLKEHHEEGTEEVVAVRPF